MDEIIAYKLSRVKDGKLYSLFINRKEEIFLNEWLKAECYPTKGFAIRRGWHCCFKPIAPHLKEKLANGEDRVWIECKVKNYQIYLRPDRQGGKWILAEFIMGKRILSWDEVNEIKSGVKE